MRHKTIGRSLLRIISACERERELAEVASARHQLVNSTADHYSPQRNTLIKNYSNALEQASLSLIESYGRARVSSLYIDAMCAMVDRFANDIIKEEARVAGVFVALHLRHEILPRADNDPRLQEAVVRTYLFSGRNDLAKSAASEYRLDCLPGIYNERKKALLNQTPGEYFLGMVSNAATAIGKAISQRINY